MTVRVDMVGTGLIGTCTERGLEAPATGRRVAIESIEQPAIYR